MHKYVQNQKSYLTECGGFKFVFAEHCDHSCIRSRLLTYDND